MLKFTTEPKRLLDLMSRGLMNGYLEHCIGAFSRTGVIVSDGTKGTYGSYCTYTPSFFKAYEVDAEPEEPHKIGIDKELLKKLTTLKFAGEDLVTVEIDLVANQFLIKAGTKKWTPKVPSPQGKMITFPVPEQPGVGHLPNNPAQLLQVQFETTIDVLVIPSEVEKASIDVEGQSFKKKFDFGGAFEDIITPKTVKETTESGRYTIFNEYLAPALANFSGDLWVNLYEKALFLTQTTTDFTLMYMIATT